MSETPRLGQPDDQVSVRFWADERRKQEPPVAPEPSGPAALVERLRHLDQGHTITCRGSRETCSCGATFWLTSDALASASQAPPCAACAGPGLGVLLQFLRAKAEAAEREVKSREEMAAVERSGTAADNEAARQMAEQMSGRPIPKRSAVQREASAQIHDRIAAKIRVEAELFWAAEATLQAQALELEAWRGWVQFVYLGGGRVTLDDDALRRAVCAAHDAALQGQYREIEELRESLKAWKARAEQSEAAMEGQQS